MKTRSSKPVRFLSVLRLCLAVGVSGPWVTVPAAAQVALDFGDLPDRSGGTARGDYQTLLANNGPRHTLSNLRLGAAVDAEANGQPNTDATGDDLAGTTPDDEDGVTIPALVAGYTATVVVKSSAAGKVNAFFDWTNDGDFLDPGETIAELTVVVGSNNLSVPVPIGAVTGAELGARFRLSTAGGLTSLGAAADGEVEDYLVTVTALDFGDLPDATSGTGTGNYQTLLVNNGPRHTITTLRLRPSIDREADGQPNSTASGDDLAGTTPDDENGVTFPTLIAGQTATVVVDCSGAGRLNAFFDWNNDGDFLDAGETIAELAVVAGGNNLSVPVPTTAVRGVGLGARFRLSTAGGLTALGPAADGEVEDYLVGVQPLAAVGNYVWLDEDGDSYQDEGEPGIPNVQVNLYDAEGALVATTVTDSHGGYRLGGLVAGTYYVDILDGTGGQGYTLPFAGMIKMPSIGFLGGDFGNQRHDETPISGGGGLTGYQVTLGPVEENLTADFGYNYNPFGDVLMNLGSSALGDRVWIDSNGNGAQDPNEVGVEGASVQLFTAGPDGLFGTPDDVAGPTMTTDANGHYRFDDLQPDAYVVKLVSSVGASHDVLGGGYQQTGDPDHFGTPGAVNDHQTTTPDILMRGDVFLNADFGYQPTTAPAGSIGDLVWFDANASSTPLPEGPLMNEYGIPGVTVALIKDTNGNRAWDAEEPIIATTITGANGTYLFPGLSLSDNGDGDPNDADYLVWVNDTDNILAGLRTTFDRIPPPNGLSGTSLSVATPNDLNQDFSYSPAEHDSGEGLIGDTLWLDNGQGGGGARNGVRDGTEPGIEGVAVELYNATTTALLGTTRTDENGKYWFGGLDPTLNYIVKVAASNFSAGGVLEGMANTGDPDGGFNSQSVVNLGAVGNDGNADPDGVKNGINLGQDFGYAAPVNQAGSIGNLIWLDQNRDAVCQGPGGPDGVLGTDDDEPGLAGVRLDLYRDLNGNEMVDPGEPRIATTVTDANGAYLFTGLALVGGGDADAEAEYVVDVVDGHGSLTGYWEPVYPSENPYTNGGNDPNDMHKRDPFGVEIGTGAGGQRVPNNLNLDFGYYVEPASVGNRVWLDGNHNGLQDPGELGLANVIVQLKGEVDTLPWTTFKTRTDANGFYSFGNLDQDETGSPDSTDFFIGLDTDPANNPALAGLVVTLLDQGPDDKLDADDPSFVWADLVHGLIDVSARIPPSDEPTVASYDFGFAPSALDFGDAPDSGVGTSQANYQTLLTEDGPRHVIVTGLSLGPAIDAEADGQPNATATGDDAAGATPDDEDGVTFPPLPLTRGANATVSYLATDTTGTAVLNAWVDWSNDGDFNDTVSGISEQVAVNVAPANRDGVTPNTLTVPVPAGAAGGPLAARFRLSTQQGLVPTGLARDGEVEDNMITTQGPPTAADLDYFGAVRIGAGEVLVSWGTLVEADLLGFRLERLAAERRWVPVTPAIIPAEGGDYRPHAYRFDDTLAQAATQYRLVGVNLRGDERVLAEATVRRGLALRAEVSAGALRLEFRGGAHGTALIETALDPARGPWEPVEAVRLDGSGAATVTRALGSSEPMRFYRVRE